MKYDVFISYRREGGYDTAKHLNDLLVRDGYKVSFDIDTLRSGDFDTQLYTRIDQCKDFILIVDQHAFDRTIDSSFNSKNDWLRCELAYALKKDKNIIPIFLSGVTGFPTNLPKDIEGVTLKNGPEYNRYYFNDFYDTLKSRFLHKKDRTKSFYYVLTLLVVFAAALYLVNSFRDYSENNGTQAKVSFEDNQYLDNDRVVDLGLSVKWASCNLGASSSEEYGDYCGYSNSHFNGTISYPYPSNNNISGSNEDYVRQRWGTPWRLPTMNEFQELIDKCDWQWANKGGKNGYIITGPNGNSIFLPAAGIYDAEDSGWGDEGERGYYQTGTIINNEYMYALNFWKSGVKIGDGMSCVYNAFRSVRPVCN